MLAHTFIHARGVGYGTERKLWERGISWENFNDNLSSNSIPAAGSKIKSISEELERSKRELENSNHIYFRDRLPESEHWRLYSKFKENCAFVDIETTGISYNSRITVIGLYNGTEIKTYILGKNLFDIKDELKNYTTIVTFNGRCFDVPFIAREFPDIEFNQIHIDLRFFLKRLNLSGGLKNIEHAMGIKRSGETAGLSGFDAVRLWRRYMRGDRDSLDLLIKYNSEDIVNLKKIIDIAYPRVKERLLFQGR